MKREMNYNVLVVGCHPDDAELGCGGTIVKHLQRGDTVVVLILTKGDKGAHHPEMKECFDSLKSLGVQTVIFGDFPDGYVPDNHKLVSFIEDTINRYNINRVYTHDPHDRHQDHRNCSLAVSAASRKINEVFLFEGPSTNPNFEPHYFIELTDEQMDMKLKSLKYYNTQIKKGIVDLWLVECTAGKHGAVCKTKYAEAFALNHFFQGGNNV